MVECKIKGNFGSRCGEIVKLKECQSCGSKHLTIDLVDEHSLIMCLDCMSGYLSLESLDDSIKRWNS